MITTDPTIKATNTNIEGYSTIFFKKDIVL